MAFVALLDANALYPAYLRDALLRLAEAEVYQVRWSRQILDEMSRNVLENNPDLLEENMERLVRTMERAFPEAMVTGHEPLIPSMTNDPKDRHVLAAAIRGRADVIVTSNVRDFPREACEPYDVDVQTPDEFLSYQWEIEDPDYLLGVLGLGLGLEVSSLGARRTPREAFEHHAELQRNRACLLAGESFGVKVVDRVLMRRNLPWHS